MARRVGWVMNEQDLRDVFAMFIVNGLISRASVFDMREVWEMADAMLEARKPKEEVGITAIKRTRKKSND
jgi:hypothetical protein